MKTVQGFIITDVDVAALNNAGKDTRSHFENAVMTKKITKHGKTYPYVSGQAWRYWWRETLQKQMQWEMSPVIRDSKIAYTEANPIKYPDDDLFGYMRAGKMEVKDPNSSKIKKENITLTRVSPLKNSVLVAIAGTKIEQNWSGMSRQQEGDPVPFAKDEYSAMMKGMFSIDLENAGTFSVQERTGFKNLNQKLMGEALKKNSEEIDDPFARDKSGNPLKLYRLPKSVRLKRVKDVINTLKFISGGAMQATNMADVTPKFIILGTLTSGNHPFSHVAMEEGIENNYATRSAISIEGLEEILSDYKDQFEGTIYIGKRKGFLDDYNDRINTLTKKFTCVTFCSVVSAIDGYVNQLEGQLP